ncbi:MAG: galactose mutarotase [Clostridia bacterium]|nr:galactose mutarotase [Clostridia bacterium]
MATKITKSAFGTLASGKEIFAFELENGNCKATVLSLGGIIQSLFVRDKNGEFRDVTLGYDTPQEYFTKGGTLGAVCGRFANRIKEGKLTIDGKTYELYCNDRGNHLHGGKIGYHQRVFDGEIVEENGDQALCLQLFSPNGEENYPGNLQLTVKYSLTGAALKIEYFAKADQKTAINLTNHAYFNLNGAGSGSAYDHTLTIAADYITPTDENMIPDGTFLPVKGTPFDFTAGKTVREGDDYTETNEHLKKGAGFDHCFVLDKGRDQALPIAVLQGNESGITMKCYTSLPAVQLYAGNFLQMDGKGGKRYDRGGGLCLETQDIPNNVNEPAYEAYGSSIYAAGEEYYSVTVYAFS